MFDRAIVCECERERKGEGEKESKGGRERAMISRSAGAYLLKIAPMGALKLRTCPNTPII